MQKSFVAPPASDFARRCGVDKRLLQREATRLAKLAMEHAPTQALADDYMDDGERAFAGQLRDFVLGQATRLTKLAGVAVKMKDESLLNEPVGLAGLRICHAERVCALPAPAMRFAWPRSVRHAERVLILMPKEWCPAASSSPTE